MIAPQRLTHPYDALVSLIDAQRVVIDAQREPIARVELWRAGLGWTVIWHDEDGQHRERFTVRAQANALFERRAGRSPSHDPTSAAIVENAGRLDAMTNCASTLPPPATITPVVLVGCAGCGVLWGAVPIDEPVVHIHDRRVFSRGAALCLTCTTGCVTPGGHSDVTRGAL